MLRTLLSVVTVVLLTAVAFLLYAKLAVPSSKKTDAGQDWTGIGVPPCPALPTSPPKATPAPPVTSPLPTPIIEASPPKEPLNPAIRETPKGRLTHIVQSGDSLSSISKFYFGVSAYYSKIAELNGLRQRDPIRVGQVLYLPDLPMALMVEKPRDIVPQQSASSEMKTADFEPMPPTLSATVSRQDAKTQK
ncbi:MAG: LysM peptidoglycan-binding domain-containing protein [Planctomycetota bacterium]